MEEKTERTIIHMMDDVLFNKNSSVIESIIDRVIDDDAFSTRVDRSLPIVLVEKRRYLQLFREYGLYRPPIEKAHLSTGDRWAVNLNGHCLVTCLDD